MSNIRISHHAQNPTDLKPVAGYNKPATNTIGDFSRKQGITFTGQQDALGKLEQSLAKNKELAEKFKGTRWEKYYKAQAEKLEKELAQQKAVAPVQTAKPFNQSLNERITAQMGQNPQYGGKTVKIGDQYVAQSAQDTRELAELNKALDSRDAAQAAQKVQQTEQAWQQYANASKEGQKTFNSIFEYRKAEKAAQEAAERGFPIKNRAVASTTPKPQDIKTNLPAAASTPVQQGTPNLPALINKPQGGGAVPQGVGTPNLPAIISKPQGGGTVPQGGGTPNLPAVIGNQPINPDPVVDVIGKKPYVKPETIIKEGGKKGFFGKLGSWLKDKGKAIGNFVKNNKGKLAIAAALIAIGALALSKCIGNKDNKPTPAVPDDNNNPTPVPVVPTEPDDKKDKPEEPTPVAPTEPDDNVTQDRPIHKDDAPEPNYTLKAKYCGMSQYVAAAYGVEEGSDKHKQIMEKLWEANPGLRNKTLYIGDQVFLPEVVIDGEKVVPNLDKQPEDLPKPTGKVKQLDRYQGYKGQERYGVGETHDDEADQYYDTDKKKVQDKANEEA